MYCKKCGNKLKEDAKFCPRCGEKVPTNVEIDYESEIDDTMEQTSGGKKKFLIIGGIAALVIVIVGIGNKQLNHNGEDDRAELNPQVYSTEMQSEETIFGATETIDALQTETKKVEIVLTEIETDFVETEPEITEKYILFDSDSRYLTENDVRDLTAHELMLARNEIYARHGRIFKDPEIRAYFNSQTWYKGIVEPDDFSTDVFNKYEKENLEFIQKYENR